MTLSSEIEVRLSTADDPRLWAEVLHSVGEDASTLVRKKVGGLYAVVGSCAHWVRPHQSRWTAAGGFAAPEGYGDGDRLLGAFPKLDWSVILQLEENSSGWKSPVEKPTTRFRSVRLAIPARSTRHQQAAVHAEWSAGTLDAKQKRTVWYGFRKVDGIWRLLARSAFGEGQRRAENWVASSLLRGF